MRSSQGSSMPNRQEEADPPRVMSLSRSSTASRARRLRTPSRASTSGSPATAMRA